MKSPKKTKWRKQQKGRIKGLATRGASLEYGLLGLKATSPARITARQLEAGRVVINRTLKRAGKLIMRPFPDLPVTKKPAEVRMGSGKGSPEYWAARTYPGNMIFEASGADLGLVSEALRKAGCRMPCRWKIVTNESMLASFSQQVNPKHIADTDNFIQG